MKKFLKKMLSAVLHSFYIFPIKKNRIVLQSFDGTAYSDSCKYVVEYIHKHCPDEYKLYWVSKSGECSGLPDYKELEIVKKHTLKFCYLCLTANILLVNILPERYLPLRKKQNVINMWHGMPYKLITDTSTFKKGSSFDVCSVCLSHNEFYTKEVLHNTFKYYGEVLECGIPRNDIFFKKNCNEIDAKVRKFCGIDENTKILLFAPTFRGDFQDTETGLDYELLHKALCNKFGGDWTILFRAHPMLKLNTDKVKNVINVSAYPDMAELLYASDILITDYSSSMWDFSLAVKPVFLYTPDLEEYAGDRGFYVDMRTIPFPLAADNNELCSVISEFNIDDYQKSVKDYHEQIGNYEFGKATETVVKKIREIAGN